MNSLLLTAMASVVVSTANSATTALFLTPGPSGDPVVSATTTLSPSGGYTVSAPASYPDDSGEFGVSFFFPGSDSGPGVHSRNFTVVFAMPLEGPLTVGTYLGTSDANAFLSTPTVGLFRLDWSTTDFLGNTLNFDPGQSTAWFNIIDLKLDSNHLISSLALDFYQFSNTGYSLAADPSTPGQQWSFGSLRLNSDVPLNVPEPVSCALASAGLLAIGYRRRR